LTKKKKQQQKRLKLYQLLITSKKGNPIKFNNQREAQTNSITGTRRKKNLSERSARTIKGGTILRAKAFSRSYHKMGILLSQKM
jgi:hypothetical protein